MKTSWIITATLLTIGSAVADGEPAREAAIPNNADALFEALPAMMPTFSAARLQAILDAYNAGQDRRYQVDLDRFGIAKGHNQLKFAEDGGYVAIELTEVGETHGGPMELDGGWDFHQSIFFTKRPLRRLARLDGPTFGFANPRYQLSVPAKDSCQGESIPEGTLAVYDIVADSLVFEGTLPARTLSFGVSVSTKPGLVAFIDTLSEEDLPGGPPADEDKQCDVGDWVKKVATSFELRCDANARNCRLRVKDRQESEGCQDIGSCD